MTTLLDANNPIIPVRGTTGCLTEFLGRIDSRLPLDCFSRPNHVGDGESAGDPYADDHDGRDDEEAAVRSGVLHDVPAYNESPRRSLTWINLPVDYPLSKLGGHRAWPAAFVQEQLPSLRLWLLGQSVP
jgi:hypothetical protein